jgi:hypothetical protein
LDAEVKSIFGNEVGTCVLQITASVALEIGLESASHWHSVMHYYRKEKHYYLYWNPTAIRDTPYKIMLEDQMYIPYANQNSDTNYPIREYTAAAHLTWKLQIFFLSKLVIKQLDL